MLNRKIGPKIHTDFDLSIKNVEKSTLNNGIRVAELNTGTQDIVKIELVLNSGRVNEAKVAAAKAAIRLLREGTINHNSNELAYKFDYYGAILKLSAGMEYSSISLVCLTKFFKDVFPIWTELIKSPSYSESELKKYTSIESQKLKNQLSKNDVTSYRLFTEKLFGEDHPYGYNTQPEDILNLSRNDVLDFYRNQICLDNAFVVISGSYDSKIRESAFDFLENLNKDSNKKEPQYFMKDHGGKTIRLETGNELQTSIKIGRLTFDRKHEDYNKLNFANTVFGGYFGSRLMKNIREDKGYTYGIYSSVESWNHGGFFYISADVGKELTEKTITEIQKEIHLLKTELVSDSEMEMVKNYILGQSLNLLDGPFATGQFIKTLYTKHLDIEDFQNHISEIKNMSSKTVIDVVNKYLDENTFTTVLVGGLNA